MEASVFALASAVALILVSTATAQNSTAKIVGIGATSCAQFLSDARYNPAVQRDYLAWAQGYMSGVLLGRPVGIDDGLDLSPIFMPHLRQLEFLNVHCSLHPSSDFSDAVNSLYKLLRERGAI